MKRNTITLVALLAVLVVVAYLVMQKPGEQSSSGSGAALVHLDSVAVDRLEIKSAKSHVVLEKQGVDWFLREPMTYKADPTAVANFIHEIKTLEVKNVVSDRPEKFEVFQVDTTSATRLTVYEHGTPTVNLLVGKIGSTYTEQYVRKLPSNDVDAVDVSMNYTVNRSANEWRDKGIVSVPKENIKEIRYQYGDTTFTVAFQDSAWMLGKDRIRTEDVTSVVNALSDFKADDFIDSTLHPTPKITGAISYGGVQLRFSFLKSQNKYAVQSSGSAQWFVVEAWKANPILKRKKDFVKIAK
ncbi:MAG TPA: DUF4340 domain-containing protein [Bacteroidota bacterium]|nr:DUF4340 domain-containing protein [Bacteroidota bacterium]